jgi:hypothetical protein
MGITMNAMAGGSDIQALPQYYVPFETVKADLLSYAISIEPSSDTTAENSAYLHRAAKAYGKKASEVRYVPIGSLRGFAAMLLDAKSGDIIGPAKQNL